MIFVMLQRARDITRKELFREPSSCRGDFLIRTPGSERNRRTLEILLLGQKIELLPRQAVDYFSIQKKGIRDRTFLTSRSRSLAVHNSNLRFTSLYGSEISCVSASHRSELSSGIPLYPTP